MQVLLNGYRRVELFFGNVKFAVFIIILFSLALAFGTFMESFHGTEYANRLVYKSLWFMGIQASMFLSILFATLIRLPLKKHLYGFYIIHSGLIILFIGSFITYQAGIDGLITLMPNLPAREVQLNEDELKIRSPALNKEIRLSLPYTAWERDIDFEYEGIRIKKFLPFSDDEMTWMKLASGEAPSTSTTYRIFTEKFGENFTLSLHPHSDFSNSLQLGPLNVHYLPGSLLKCFSALQGELFLWNVETNECVIPERDKIKLKQMTGKLLAQVSFRQEKFSFFPDISPLPLDEEMKLDSDSSYRIFSRKLFEKGVHLFLFGGSAVFHNKKSGKWQTLNLNKNESVKLPWMGLKLQLLLTRDDAYPVMKPFAMSPVQENGRVVKGDLKAVEVELEGKSIWVKSTAPMETTYRGQPIVFELSRKSIQLPYEIILDNFKMKHDPGTTNPASYESFVTLFDGNKGSSNHHIFMNNPMKKDQFTFYQSSYFKVDENNYGSVLSVNMDPGRFMKYLGSFLLVFGSIWHYLARGQRRKIKPRAS